MDYRQTHICNSFKTAVWTIESGIVLCCRFKFLHNEISLIQHFYLYQSIPIYTNRRSIDFISLFFMVEIKRKVSFFFISLLGLYLLLSSFPFFPSFSCILMPLWSFVLPLMMIFIVISKILAKTILFYTTLHRQTPQRKDKLFICLLPMLAISLKDRLKYFFQYFQSFSIYQSLNQIFNSTKKSMWL